MAYLKKKTKKWVTLIGVALGVLIVSPFWAVGAKSESVSKLITNVFQSHKASADTLGSTTTTTGGGGAGGEGGGCGNCCGGSSCFVQGTLIEMADGTEKFVERVQIGDSTKGGVVTAVMQFSIEGETIFNYNGVLVASSHAVFEEGEWKRVGDAEYAQPVKVNERVVYNFNCTKHRIYVKGIVFGDDVELDSNHPVEIAYFNDAIKALNEESLHIKTEESFAFTINS